MTGLSSQQATNWREGRRLRAWELSQEGWPQQHIAEALGVSKGAVSQWLSRARVYGPQALRHCQPPGRQPKLAHQQRLQLLELLAQGPSAFGFRGDVWTQPRVAEVIQRHFRVKYHPSQVGRILKQYGWSRQKPSRRAQQRGRDGLRLVAPGGQDLCTQGPDSGAPGTSQPRPSVGNQWHHRPRLAAR